MKKYKFIIPTVLALAMTAPAMACFTLNFFIGSLDICCGGNGCTIQLV